MLFVTGELIINLPSILMGAQKKGGIVSQVEIMQTAMAHVWSKLSGTNGREYLDKQLYMKNFESICQDFIDATLAIESRNVGCEGKVQ